MNDLLAFKRNAIMLGLCTSYKDKWDAATSKEALMEIATDAKGMDMIADSISNGWGLSSSYIAKNFSDYINGKWQRNKDGYTSEMYVSHKSDVDIRSTLTLFVDCECDIVVSKAKTNSTPNDRKYNDCRYVSFKSPMTCFSTFLQYIGFPSDNKASYFSKYSHNRTLSYK